MPKTIVVGLDGANWNLLEPWLEVGDLPNIAKLRERGTAADMQSELPPVTCPNWRCYSTGKNPGKLGVYWWEKIDSEIRSLSTPTSRSFKSANYWDYLNDNGQTAGIVNLPMTYPPFELDGYMIAGGPGSKQEEYTTPTSLGEELTAKGYRLRPRSVVTSSDDFEAAETIVDLIDQRLATFRELLDNRPVDVAHCTVFYINTLQHYFWRDEPTHRAWQVIDEHIGAIRESYPDATLMLMSDHGCTEIETVFYANEWLEQEGFLQTDADVTSVLEQLGITEQRLTKFTDKLGVREHISALAPEFIKQRVPGEEGATRKRKLKRVNWDESRALASGQGLVYILDGKKETTEKIINALADLDSEISGTPIARNVFHCQEAYEGPYVDDAPEIVFDQTPGVHTSGAIGENQVFEKVGHWRAENVQTGLFLADGPAVSETIDSQMKITDIAPTILQSVGCPIPEDMDGAPLRLFDRGEPTFTKPLSPDYIEASPSDNVEDRLTDLGYLQ